MDVPEFVPTHEVPAGGMPTWSRPDPGVAPDHRLDAGLLVQLLEETTGWGHVRCDNGREAWVDARTLGPITVPPLRTELVIPAGGLDAYASPDSAEAAIARLDPSLPVTVTAIQADWLRVRASNGWEGWIPAGTLVPAPATSQ